MKRIDTHMLKGFQIAVLTTGYRRKWRSLPFYATRNRRERSVYCGLGPLYLRLRKRKR